MGQTIKVQPAKVEDIRELTELAKAYHEEHWFGTHTEFDAEHCFNMIQQFSIGPQANVIVAFDNGDIVGFSIAFLSPLHWSKQLRCTISFNYIKPEHRSKGILEMIVNNHKEFAKAYKCVDINIGDGAQYKGKFSMVAHGLGFDKIGNDCYQVLSYDE
tara:strand:- start:2957 stop:3430 length:474 start_codon:yes stop_codon:yes gene_type:complete